jgi:hypothetical protein
MAIDKAMMADDYLPREDFEVEIVPDDEGSSIEGEQEPEVDAGHMANLAELMDDEQLDEIATVILDYFRADEDSRSEWIDAYTKGLNYLGFSIEDRDKPFKGAAGVFHPVLTEAVVRFQSNAIVEIFPAAGPVLTKIVGKETPEKMKQSQRIREELNYQLTDNMCEYRNETEQLLFRLPLAGSVFKKVYFDEARQKPTALMVAAEDLIVNYGASELATAERYTHRMKKSTNEVKKLQRSGLYRKFDLQAPSPSYSEAEEAEAELSGTEIRQDKDNRHTLLECHIHYNLPEPFNDPDGIADPYIITIDKDSRQVLSIYRNWAEDDNEARNPETYFVHYQYMPGLGFYGIGLIHLLGSIAKSATSILRQLIDAGTLSNLPGGLKTKGLRTKNDDTPVQPGEWRDVDVPGGSIKDNLYPMPYKEPSVVLTTLLQNLIDEGRRIGSIADVDIGSQQQNAPVGTTLALMERSLKVMTAVHARLHASLKKELKLIAKIVADYMPPQYDWDETGEYNRQQDFDGRIDVIPVSDPNASTQAHRIVQLQAVQQMAQQNPELYNLKKLHQKALHTIGYKDVEEILPVDEDPPRLDPVQENMAVLTSQPIKVYMDQDHTAHIQAHLSWLNDPKIMELVGQSPSAQRVQGQMEAHIAEHLAFQYRMEMEQQIGAPLPEMGEELPPNVEASLSRMVAEASVKLREKHDKEAAAKVAEEMAKDPEYVLKERKQALDESKFAHQMGKDAVDTVVDIARQASDEMIDMRKIESQEEIAGQKIAADLVTFGAGLESEERREGVTLGKEISENIRADLRDAQKMEQEINEREKDRRAEIAKARASSKPSSNSNS